MKKLFTLLTLFVAIAAGAGAAGPTIIAQPVSVTYTIGDATYPKMNVVATASAGDLTYEWYGKADVDTYAPAGVTTSELDLTAFIGNVIELFREECFGEYVFMCKVSDGNGTVESIPATLTIAASTTAPSILKQPVNVMYTIGDTTYPKMNVEAIASSGNLTYEWYVKADADTYAPAGITTSELDLRAFIENVIEIFHEEAAGDYFFKCEVSDGNGSVESTPATLTILSGEPTTVKDIKPATDAPAYGIKKYIKNGQIVIETANGIYGVSGGQVK